MGTVAYFIYHRFPAETPKAIPAYAKWIWCPYNTEVEVTIQHLLKHQPKAEIWLDSLLGSLLPANVYRLADYKAVEPKAQRKKIFLYAQSDTLSNSISIFSEHLGEHQLHYLVPATKNKERSDEFFQQKGIQYQTYSYKLLKQVKPDVLVFLNDWAKEAKRIIAHCRSLGIPTICLQESVIDFGDHFKRMQWSDYAFIQGAQTILDLDRKHYFITGNPRYEVIKPKEGNTGTYVLINCNFTYGIFEDKRTEWLDAIHEVLCTHSTDYAISQHPRDTGDLSKYKKVLPSSSAKVEQQLSGAKYLITRFSSLIHEALVMGVPVIYYNPHGESMQYDFGFDHKLIFLAKNKAELEEAVIKLENTQVDKVYLNEYLTAHCLNRNSLPSKNIAYLLSNYRFPATAANWKDYRNMVLYYPALKDLIIQTKKKLNR